MKITKLLLGTLLISMVGTAQEGTTGFTRVRTEYHYATFDKLSLKCLDADSNEVEFAPQFPDAAKASLYWDNNAKDGKLYVNYYLGNDIADHDNSKNYYFQLQNRQSIYTHSNKWVTGIGTVPVKYRPAQTGSAGEVEPQAEIDYNLSGFVGYSFSGETYTHYNNVGIKRKRCYDVTLSALIGVSNVIVDSRASFLSTEPTNNTFSAPAFNFGGALQTTIKNFVFGGAMGFDYMLDGYAKSWHYNGRPWYGVIFGYRKDIFTGKGNAFYK